MAYNISPATVTWTVFSSSRDLTAFQEEAFSLGQMIAEFGHHYCFGGDMTGLMATVCNGVTKHRQNDPVNSSSQILSLPHKIFHKPENDHYFDKVEVQENLQTQQQSLLQNGHEIVVMPGGLGSFAEITNSLAMMCYYGEKPKNLWLVNAQCTKGKPQRYYDGLLQQKQTMIDCGAADESHFKNLKIVPSVAALREAYLTGNSAGYSL